MTTTPTTPDDEQRRFIRGLFGSRPEPQRPDESDAQFGRRCLFHNPENPETFQPAKENK